MPSSQFNQISSVVEIMFALNPKSILDVGVGFGKYGVLSREYLEIKGEKKGEYKNFSRRIDGIEGFSDYITPLHKFIYNKIYVGDALKIVPELKRRYDLILIIGTIEHFEKEDGKKLLKMLLEKSDGVLVSTPKYTGEQPAYYGNKYEVHRSQWTRKDFYNLGSCVFFPDFQSHLVYIGKKKNIDKLRNAWRFKSLKRVLAYCFPWLIPLKRNIDARLKQRPI